MIVYFSTVKRKRPVKEAGELVKLNWSNKEVLNSVLLFPSKPNIDIDPNPRGNSRGGKGILISNDELFVGTYHSILVFNFDLILKRRITNNLFVNIHEMCFDNSDILVSSTAIDGAMKVDQNGNLIKSWWPREIKEIQDKFDIVPFNMDKGIDNRLIHLDKEVSTKVGHIHINCIYKQGNSVFLLLNKLGVLCKVEPNFEIIINDNELKGSHSFKVIDDGNYGLLCGTRQHSIIVIDLNKKKIIDRIKLLAFSEIKKLHVNFPDEPFNQSIFVRGLSLINKDSVLVGISPASVIEVDIKKKKLNDMFQYSNDVGDAIHGLVHR